MDDLVLKDGAKPYCTLCRISLPSDTPKAIKQHLKSKTHKIAQRPDAQVDENNTNDVLIENLDLREAETCESDDANDDRCELCRMRNATNTRHTIESYRRSLEAGEEVFPCFPPRFVRSPKCLFPKCRHPFVTLESGRLPEVPDSLEQCMDLYCNAGANEGNKPPNVDIGGENVKMKSMAGARRALLQAATDGTIFWAALVVDAIEHPIWWPRPHKSAPCVCEGDVPNFNQVIIGSGPTDIGIHIDNAPAPGTCSSACASGMMSKSNSMGSRHPAPATTGDHASNNGDASAQACHAAAGPDTGADTKAVRGSDGSKDREDRAAAALDYVDPADPQYMHCLSAGAESVHVDTYITMARGGKAVIMLPAGGNFFHPKAPFPRSVSPELMQQILDAGGYYFNLEPLDPAGAGGINGGHVTLFTPKSWHHWLLGKTDWHLIFGGSRF